MVLGGGALRVTRLPMEDMEPYEPLEMSHGLDQAGVSYRRDEGARVIFVARETYRGDMRQFGRPGLTFTKGTKIEYVPTPNEAQNGMWKGRISRREGWFPERVVQPVYARATDSYRAQSRDELSFDEGEIVQVDTTRTGEDFWWRVSVTGGRGGLAPATFLEVVPAPAASPPRNVRPDVPEAGAGLNGWAQAPSTGQRLLPRGLESSHEGPTCAECYAPFQVVAATILASAPFRYIMYVIILLCTVLMGVQTHSATMDEEWVRTSVHFFDVIAVLVFAVEFVLKVGSHGMQPYLLFWRRGEPDWWELLNVVILLASVVALFRGSPGAWVRALRVFQLGLNALRSEVVGRRTRPFAVLVVAMAKGIYSSLYILLLLAVIYLIFAVAGVSFMGANDPKHFGDLEDAVLTLYQVTTMDNWADVMYINTEGCTEANYARWLAVGYECTSPTPRPIFAPVYFGLFTIVSSLVVVSLFVGVITVSLQHALHQQIRSERCSLPFRAQRHVHHLERAKPLIRRAWEPAEEVLCFYEMDCQYLTRVEGAGGGVSLRRAYVELSRYCERFARSETAEYVMMPAIALSTVLIVVDTDAPGSLDRATDDLLNALVVLVFVVEVAAKTVACGLQPSRFFRNSWNALDLIVVSFSVLPLDRLAMVNSLHLRMVRLLRIIKIFSVLESLQLIVEGLAAGLSSISVLFLLLAIVVYMYAVLGVHLFRGNDPVFFGSLEAALLTMYQCATLEDWSERLYVNVYGCAKYGYEDLPGRCTASLGAPALATTFFCSYTVVTSFVRPRVTREMPRGGAPLTTLGPWLPSLAAAAGSAQLLRGRRDHGRGHRHPPAQQAPERGAL